MCCRCGSGTSHTAALCWLADLFQGPPHRDERTVFPSMGRWCSSSRASFRRVLPGATEQTFSTLAHGFGGPTQQCGLFLDSSITRIQSAITHQGWRDEVARWSPRRRFTEPPEGGAESVSGRRLFWLSVLAAVIAMAGTYAGIAAQATGPVTVMQVVWTSLAVVCAAIFAFMASQAGGYALRNRPTARQALPVKGVAAPLWGGVPPRNPTFTNRDEAMDLMRTILAGNAPEDRGGLRSCALHGLGGIGKTSLAVEYAHRFRKDYRLIWWVRAEHATSIADDLVRLLVALTGETNFEQADAFPRLWNELAGKEPWLIVYDNAKDPTALRELWPSGGTGDVIVTSRTDTWAELVDEAITVEVFSRDDAVTLLRARTQDDDEPSAAEVADRLGRLPLALVQAAAYVTQTRTTFERYARLMTEQMGDVLATTPPSDYNVPVAITWSMSIAEANAQARGARELLIFWSFLASEQIPRDMTSSCASNLPDPLPEIATNRVRYDLAIAALTHYSLLTASPSYLLVHRLVQLTVRLGLPEAEQRAWATIAVRVLSHLFPRNPRDRETWEVCARLTPHVLVASAHATQLGSDEPIGDLLMRAGIYNMARDFLHPAADLLRMAVLDYERAEGAESLIVAVACGELAHVLHRQAKLVEELAVSERAIRIRERLNGTEDPGLVEPLKQLGTTFLELSRLNEATDAYQRALSLVESAQGDDTRNALPILDSLAWLNWRKGNYRTALHLGQRQLRIDVSTGSPDLHTTASIHHGLGTFHHAMGELDAAIQHQSQSVNMYAVGDGPESYETLKREEALAWHLVEHGETTRAIELVDHALRGLSRIHGDDHPDLGVVLKVRAAAFLAENRPAEAHADLVRAAGIYEVCFGPDHPYVAHTLTPLAHAQLTLGEREAARASIERAKKILKSQYGTHPSYAETIRVQALLSRANGDEAIAGQLVHEAETLILAARTT